MFTFTTTVAAVPAEGGTRLILIGGGDALLRAADLDAAASAIAASGLGPIVEVDADNSYFDRQRYGLGWTWDDFPFYYAPITTALCLEDNVVHATVTPGERPGSPATVALQPNVPLSTINRITTGRPRTKDTADVDRDGETIVFVGSIPQDAKPEVVDAAVPDPESYALEVFTDALVAHGVNLREGALGKVVAVPLPSGTSIVWRHESVPLARYLADFWYPSDNLVGEMLLKSLGVARSGVPGTSANGAALESDWLRAIGVDPARLDISDGSGLSVYDRISPRALVRILQADWNGPNRDLVLDALPVAGVRGSMRDDFKGTPAERRTFAKTGTRRYARGLAGYLRPFRHGAITFALMVDDWMGDDDGIQAVRARVLSRMIRS